MERMLGTEQESQQSFKLQPCQSTSETASLTRGHRVRCDPCYKSKKSCDLSRPACSSCSRLGKQCVYPTGLDNVLRSENGKVAKRANLLWRQRAACPPPEYEAPKSRDRQVSFSHDSQRAAAGSEYTSTRCLMPSNASILQTNALEELATDFGPSKLDMNPWQRAFSLMSTAYTSHPADSAIALSISALAFARLAESLHQSQRSQPDQENGVHSRTLSSSDPRISCLAVTLGRNNYGRSLTRITRALQTPDVKSLDQTLYGIWVLGLFELVDPPTHTSPQWRWTSHVRGAAAFLRGQNRASYYTKFSNAVLDQIFVQTLITNLLTFEKPSLPLGLFITEVRERNVGVELVMKMYLVAEICSALANATQRHRKAPSGITCTTITYLLFSGLQEDNDLTQWGEKVSFLCEETGEDLSPWNTQYTHQSGSNAIPLSLYFSIRLELQYLILRAAKALQVETARLSKSQNLSLQDELRRKAVASAQALCHAVDTITGENFNGSHSSMLTGFYVLYPLRMFSKAVLGDEALASMLEERAPGLKDWGINLLKVSRERISFSYAQRSRP